ncbi:MAG: S8 family serine peptidase [Candidatus Acidiferrales bacterium]
MSTLKRRLIILVVFFSLLGAIPASAQQRYIVQTTKGLDSVLNLCLSAGCQVQGSLDGAIGKTFLVTSNKNLLANLVGGVLNLLERLLGITSVEVDQLLPLPVGPVPTNTSGLYDSVPVNYYGSTVTEGYVDQPATEIIQLQNSQQAFNVSGTGVIVADIDTGVDPYHPALYRVLLPGYDFTRNQPGASEWLDVPALQDTSSDSGSQQEQPAVVQQRTVAVLDQRTVAVLDGGPYSDFGHGTMTAGLIHLVAPTAKILPLKAFSANGEGYLSNIVAALYYAVQNNANAVNMSFDFTTPSQALSSAVSYATQSGVVLVAAAGNSTTNAAAYPAALTNSVMGIASTSDSDTISTFSNYGTPDVWIGAPGENIVSTYPGGTYASGSGTSFSCPLVTGSAALLIDARAPVNQSQAASAISHGVRLTPNLNNGRLDIFTAIQAWLEASEGR